MRSALIFAVLVLAAAPAAAQPRQAAGPVPDRGMAAIGVSIGAAMPGDDQLNSGLFLGVDGETYFTPRVSLRGKVSGAWWGFDRRRRADFSVRPVSVTGNLVYNWEEGIWHPYATAGLGVYSFRFTEDGLDSHDTTVGFNLGGGVEYFIHRRDAVTLELLFHPLVGQVHSRFSSYTPYFWSIAGGYKAYF
jgi:hypothetical protein